MKIQIVNPYSCCAGFFTGAPSGRIDLHPGNADNCGMNSLECSQADFYEQHSCLIQAVPMGQRFFFRLNRHDGRVKSGTAHFWGYLEEEDGRHFLVMEKRISSDMALSQPCYFWIDTYSPDNFFLLNTDNQSILTSDGVIILQEGNFLGSKDGEIQELSPKEVLEALSKEGTTTSPAYEALRLKPITRRPPNARKGTVIFNEISDSLEFYNGTEWKTI